jgi:hypothetical protein
VRVEEHTRRWNGMEARNKEDRKDEADEELRTAAPQGVSPSCAGCKLRSLFISAASLGT